MRDGRIMIEYVLLQNYDDSVDILLNLGSLVPRDVFMFTNEKTKLAIETHLIKNKDRLEEIFTKGSSMLGRRGLLACAKRLSKGSKEEKIAH